MQHACTLGGKVPHTISKEEGFEVTRSSPAARNMHVHTDTGNTPMFHAQLQTLVRSTLHPAASVSRQLLALALALLEHTIVVMGIDACAFSKQSQHRTAADLGSWRLLSLTALPQDTLIIQHQRFHCLLGYITLQNDTNTSLHVADTVSQVRDEVTGWHSRLQAPGIV
jgi:hypothetical protein